MAAAVACERARVRVVFGLTTGVRAFSCFADFGLRVGNLHNGMCAIPVYTDTQGRN